MQREIKNKIDLLNKQDPAWQKRITDYLKDQDSSQLDADLLQAFYELLSIVYNGFKEESLEREDTLSVFDDELRKQVGHMVDNRLNSYYTFMPLRLKESDSIIQIEQFVDNIWAQFVLRFNPKITKENDLNINEEQVVALMAGIDSLAMHCVSRLLTYNGIVELIAEKTEMGEEFCNYLARKIDKDFNELRLNYLVRKIRN